MSPALQLADAVEFLHEKDRSGMCNALTFSYFTVMYFCRNVFNIKKIFFLHKARKQYTHASKNIKLSDFGLSKKIVEASSNASKIFGVLPYFDPVTRKVLTITKVIVKITS